MFDPWPVHSVQYYDFTFYGTASGKFITAVFFKLVDQENYFYPVKFFDDWILALTYTSEFMTYTSPTGAKGYFGEWFNFVARPNILDRVPYDEWPYWLLHH
ncbi:MAG: hypothetical protein WCL08_05030 [Verrucomicrobiota bacterium]